MNPREHHSPRLPLSELRRLLSKCRKPPQGKDPAGRFLHAETITMTDVAREAQIACRSRLYAFLKGDPNCKLGPVPLRRLSRFLTHMEHGLVVKDGGQLVYRTAEQRDAEAKALNRQPKRPDFVVHLEWTARGPRTVLGPSLSAPESIPSIFRQFRRAKL
jgi:hypothetical protein